MSERFEGKRALVTGAGVGIGRAVALALGREGASVALHCHRSLEGARGVARELSDLGRQAWILEADLADPEEAESLGREACELLGPMDYLVNSAAVWPEDRLESLSWEDLSATLRVNAFAPLTLARALARQGRAGAVVNLLDTRMLGRDPSHASYHLSKRTLGTLTRMLAWELAPLVRVNGVAPGAIERDSLPHGVREAWARANRLGRLGSEEEVAEAVVYLLGAEFVTGQVLHVDGGRFLEGAMYDGV